ncbi:MAG: hypothetical protein HDS88_02980 [Bacteroidales bacterium]|nr:hypothetical protein [Bacteroidales bacterium]
MRLCLLLFIIAVIAPLSAAQRTTRTHLRPKQHQKTDTLPGQVHIIPDTADFTIAGFNKPLNSLRETFHFSNHLGRTVTELFITVNYYDTSERQLHRQSRHIRWQIPPGETSLISYPSFDRQQSFYYHLSRQPRVKATPFLVTISVDSLAIIP